MIDTAFLRSGRFDRVVQVGLPTSSERESIFMVHARRMRLKYDTDDDYELLKVDDDEDSPMGLRLLAHSVATETKGYSGADIAALCRAAAVRALIEDGADAHVTRNHFSMALKYDVRPSSDDALVRQLASWRPGRY
jgi:transitional endoplasmic reticulum ATPase